MGLIVEGIIDCAMDREEKPGRSLALEPLLLALSSADRQVRIFGPVIGRRTGRLVSIRKAKFLGRGTVGCELVRHDRLGAHALMLRHFAQASRCNLFVPPLLDEHIQDLPSSSTAHHRNIRFQPILTTAQLASPASA